MSIGRMDQAVVPAGPSFRVVIAGFALGFSRNRWGTFFVWGNARKRLRVKTFPT